MMVLGGWEEDGVGQLEVGAEELPDEERDGDGGGDVRDGPSPCGRGGEAPAECGYGGHEGDGAEEGEVVIGERGGGERQQGEDEGDGHGRFSWLRQTA